MSVVEANALTVVNIGRAGHEGGLNVTDGRIELMGGGDRVGGGVDALTFAYTMASGDFDLVARLHQAESSRRRGEESHSAAVGGIAVRENLEPGARGVLLLAPPVGHPQLEARYEVGGGTRKVAEPYKDVPFPMWIKLERRGPSFHAWVSHDGMQWSHFVSTDLELRRVLYAGLVLAIPPRAEMGRAVFSDVYIEQLPSSNL